MLKVSAQNIVFSHNQTIKSLTLENLYPTNIIFKIKVNAVGVVNVEPTKGFIRSSSSVSFIIKSLKKQKFEIKILFTYGLIQDKNEQFGLQWQNVKKNSKFQHRIIQVIRSQDYKGYAISEKRISFKEVDQKVKTRRQMKNSEEKKEHAKSSSLQKDFRKRSPLSKTQASQLKSSLKISSTKRSQSMQEYYKQLFLQEQPLQGIPLYSGQQMQQIIEDLHECQKYLEAQKIKNIKILQQLSISEAKLKEVTEDKMHIQVHKSIGIICDEYHTSFTYLVILGLACFVFGFMLGKIQAEIV